MKEYVLSYYPEFKCIGGKCKHTCCAGWEIDIDEQSLSKYKECSSFFGALKNGVNFKKAKFKTDKRKRCAFLNDDGLCDLIINLGEESLCQVCSDHPRFRSFFTERTETGLGFCCEEAARIILSFNGKIQPVLVSCDGGEKALDFTEKNVLDFREKALEILQDSETSIDERIEKILKSCSFSFEERDVNKIIKTFLSLERVDKNWTKRLKSISYPIKTATDKELAGYCERFLINSVYRHLSDAEDTMWVRARTIACILSLWIINTIINKEKEGDKDLLELVIDVIRAYSVEVEYSQKNLDKLFAFCYKIIRL